MQLVCDDLRQRRTDVLPDFNFAGEHCDVAFFVDEDPRRKIAGRRASLRAAAGFLRRHVRHRRDDKHAATDRGKDFQKVAAIDIKSIAR